MSKLLSLCFVGSTPLIKGVKVHPLNEGGMGCQGKYVIFLFPMVNFWDRFCTTFLEKPAELGISGHLLAPYRDTAILSLRYPISRHTLSGRFAAPPKSRYIFPLVLSFTQAHMCDTPICNVSRDHCSTCHENKHEIVLRDYRYKHRRNMKSIVAGPLSLGRS